MMVDARLVVALSTLLWLSTTGWTAAQAQDLYPSRQHVKMALLHSPSGDESPMQEVGPGERSPLLALGLSAAVPGLGQAYNREWLMAGLHAAVEVALWTGIVTWRARGNDGVDAYRAFAHAGWDPTRYARWLNAYRDEQGITSAGAVDVARYEALQIDFNAPGSWSEEDAAAVRRLFEEIRGLERVMTHDETGASFSHVLPYFGEQQYYELIGKYYQFAPGWCDYGDVACGGSTTPWYGDGGERTGYMTPSDDNASDRFEQYARNHQEANDLLRRASRLTAVVLLNHLVAGVEAAVSSRLHNIRLQSQLTTGIDGEMAWRTSVAVSL